MVGNKGKKQREQEKEKNYLAGNNIRDEGAKAMSEMLKVNTTLTSLDLSGEGKKGGKTENKKRKIRMNDRQ